LGNQKRNINRPRAIGLAINNNKVLLHKCEGDNFWSFPGGGIEFFESSIETVKREMQEEMGVEVIVDKLVWIAEVFGEDEYMKLHEIGFYYLIKLPEEFYSLSEFEGSEEGKRLFYKWFKIDELEEVYLLPSFAKKRLKNLNSKFDNV
jgi:8-oxo-dGTP pyrophosphatase MutT (NUDIX family)